MCVVQQLWVKFVGLPCGGPQAAVSYTAAKGRIARIPQVVRYSRSFSPGATRVPRGILPLYVRVWVWKSRLDGSSLSPP